MKPFPSNLNFTFTETCPLPYPSYEDDVVAVLDFVKNLFAQYFDNVDAHPLCVRSEYPNKDYPMTVYETNTIYLNVSPFSNDGKPGCYWSQFIYQFSHELCHYMNFGHVPQSMRWFEESLCEMASHFFLKKAAILWTSAPPYPHWQNYASSIMNYEIQNCSNVTCFDLKLLSNPDSKLLHRLMSFEYQRELNRFVALNLLPFFESTPSLWRIVPFLPELKNECSFTDNLDLLSTLSGENTNNILNLFLP